MWNIGVKNELLPLIYKMNIRAEVVVKTPHGVTQSFITRKGVKQGTVLGPDLCSTSTAEYCDMNDGVPVGDLMLGPFAYVDDLIQVCNCAYDTKVSHAKAVAFSKLKRLKFILLSLRLSRILLRGS